MWGGSLRRHRWTIEADAVLIEERPVVPLAGRRRLRRLPLGVIASLSTVPNGADEAGSHDPPRRALRVAARAGARYGPARKLDQKGLAAFAARLQAAITTAGGVAPPVTDGLGFWNRPPGLALLSVALLASLTVAALALWGLWQGTIVRVRTHEAAAFLVVLPIGVGWMLRRAWQRRRSVLRAMR